MPSRRSFITIRTFPVNRPSRFSRRFPRRCRTGPPPRRQDPAPGPAGPGRRPGSLPLCWFSVSPANRFQTGALKAPDEASVPTAGLSMPGAGKLLFFHAPQAPGKCRLGMLPQDLREVAVSLVARGTLVCCQIRFAQPRSMLSLGPQSGGGPRLRQSVSDSTLPTSPGMGQ